MRLFETVKRANKPGPPEHSVTLRVACAGAVITGIAACRAEGELSGAVAGGSITLVVLGMILAYRTRERPLPWIKPILAVSAVAAFVWFFRQLTGQPIYDVSTVENPLAVLFVWVQVAHAFDVPARRDLSFSLAGSASLMAVAAAQAIDLAFGVYVALWLVFGLAALLAMWSSASQGGRLRARGVIAALAAVVVTGTTVLVVLPAPHVAGRIDFPSNAGPGTPVPVPGGLAGDVNVEQLAKPGNPADATRVGGYLGFANRLDTALRGALGNTVVMRVRADRPSYWIGETFDTWDGANWSVATTTTQLAAIWTTSSPFVIPRTVAHPVDGADGPADLLHRPVLAQPGVPRRQCARGVVPGQQPLRLRRRLDRLPHRARARAPSTRCSPMWTRRLPNSCAPRRGTAGDPASVRRTGPATAPSLPAGRRHWPSRSPPVRPLPTTRCRASSPGSATHTHYSTDIPPLAPGQDTVDEFLFGNRIGFCEQISTSLAVMLRSLGIPAREAVGYVPGPYNPITDLYDVEAKDAHAWVQVWFPGYGWQSFDPTAVVPLANPSPGSTLLHEAAGVAGSPPLGPHRGRPRGDLRRDAGREVAAPPAAHLGRTGRPEHRDSGQAGGPETSPQRDPDRVRRRPRPSGGRPLRDVAGTGRRRRSERVRRPPSDARGQPPAPGIDARPTW